MSRAITIRKGVQSLMIIDATSVERIMIIVKIPTTGDDLFEETSYASMTEVFLFVS